MGNSLMQLMNVNKKLSDFFSLKNINLELFEGEVHVIIGENGSGKTSLMNIIWGSYPLDSGEISIHGIPVSIASPIDAKRQGIAIIHQDFPLFEQFSIAENVYLDNKPFSNKTLKLIDRKKMYSDCQKLIDKLGFSLNSKSLVQNLNIAQKQMVEFCKAYVSGAQIIIMDEPTASLTETESQLFFNAIRELKNSGAGILYISHKLDEIRQVGDRISVLRSGELVGTSRMDEMDTDSIIHMMTGMELKERYPKLKVKIGRDALRVSNLSCRDSLKNINFVLHKREILGIIGLVGSGRTKIAKCIFGLDKYDSGELFIDNHRVFILDPSDAIRHGIGYVTEDRNTDGLFLYLNIPENISAPNIDKVSDKLLIDRTIEKELAENYVGKLGINVGTISNKAAYISSGNQQKVVLAKWIMSKSKILILDEPTKGIDIASKVDVYNLMNEMVVKNVSIILISSDVDEVLGMCDRVMVLFDGKISAILSRQEANREKIMFYATGGK